MARAVVIERELLKSKAYRTLSGTAKNVFADFMMKRKLQKLKAAKRGRKDDWVITNNGEIEYSYTEAEKKDPPIKRSSFARALDQLIEHGFIDIADPGSGGWRGDKSLYSISERWRLYGTPDFKKAERQKDVKEGRKGAKTRFGRQNITAKTGYQDESYTAKNGYQDSKNTS